MQGGGEVGESVPIYAQARTHTLQYFKRERRGVGGGEGSGGENVHSTDLVAAARVSFCRCRSGLC